MESAAVASVCGLHEVPCAGIRIIANLIDDSEQSITGFEQELQTAAARLCATLLSALAALATAEF
jgi:nucleoside phosphorylase